MEHVCTSILYRMQSTIMLQVEHNGPKNIEDETDSSAYENETHMLSVLDVILNKSYHKLGFQNGKGKTYEGLLTTSSIQQAQRYYELLKQVKEGKKSLKIDEKVLQVLRIFLSLRLHIRSRKMRRVLR